LAKYAPFGQKRVEFACFFDIKPGLEKLPVAIGSKGGMISIFDYTG
jgi:hypothetical protein